jgi:hypothetical protein
LIRLCLFAAPVAAVLPERHRDGQLDHRATVARWSHIAQMRRETFDKLPHRAIGGGMEPNLLGRILSMNPLPPGDAGLVIMLDRLHRLRAQGSDPEVRAAKQELKRAIETTKPRGLPGALAKLKYLAAHPDRAAEIGLGDVIAVVERVGARRRFNDSTRE